MREGGSSETLPELAAAAKTLDADEAAQRAEVAAQRARATAARGQLTDRRGEMERLDRSLVRPTPRPPARPTAAAPRRPRFPCGAHVL